MYVGCAFAGPLAGLAGKGLSAGARLPGAARAASLISKGATAAQAFTTAVKETRAVMTVAKVTEVVISPATNTAAWVTKTVAPRVAKVAATPIGRVVATPLRAYRWLRRVQKAFDSLSGKFVGRFFGKAPKDLPPFRPIDVSVEQFKNDIRIQQDIYAKALDLQARQQAFADKLLLDNGIIGSAKSILKRPDFEEFVEGVILKCERKGYTNLSQMDDMVRGRFNLATAEDVRVAANVLQDQNIVAEFTLKGEITPPRRRIELPNGTSGYGYPRYHVIINDSVTGLSHEWQVGTKAATDVFEKQGITIPKGLELKEGMHNDLHDIEYDIFKPIQESDNSEIRQLAESLGIPEFRKQVDQLGAEAGNQGVNLPNFETRLNELHNTASRILRELVQLRGPDFIKGYFH